MTPTLSLDDKEFRRALDEAARDTGRTSVEILRDVMRLWVEDLVKKTVDRKGKAHQRKAIQRDVSKILAPIKVDAALKAWRDALEQDGVTEIYRRAKNGTAYKITEESLDHKVMTNLDKIRNFHTSQRDKRGRVKGKVAPGNEWYPGRALVPESTFRRFMQSLSRDIGKTKAGWTRGARMFKASVKSYVSRNDKFGFANGDANDTLNESRLDGFAYSENSVPWIRNVDRMMEVTLRTRERDMKSGKYLARWAKAMKAQGVSA